MKIFSIFSIFILSNNIKATDINSNSYNNSEVKENLKEELEKIKKLREKEREREKNYKEKENREYDIRLKEAVDKQNEKNEKLEQEIYRIRKKEELKKPEIEGRKKLDEKLKKEMYYDNKFSIFIAYNIGNSFGKYDQPNELFQLQSLITGDVIQAIPYTDRTTFKGTYWDGLKIGINYRRNKNIAFSFKFSSDGTDFKSMGVDFTKYIYGSFAALKGFPNANLYPYFPIKYILNVWTYNLGTDYYFHSINDKLELYAGGEFGLGNFYVRTSALDQDYTYDSQRIFKLNLRTGIQYNFKDRHHIKIEPFYSYFWGDRFHLNYIGISFAYMYTFGI